MSAVLSTCGTFRYRLDRECGLIPSEYNEDGKVFAYFGINPSTADATVDDATVRKWTGFTERNGGSRFIVGNVFSYRATDVKELDRANRAHQLVQGPDHWPHIFDIIAEADILVPCWGRSQKVDRNLRPLVGMLLDYLLESGKPVKHFGLTDGGDPKHPLFLPYETELRLWGER